MFLQWFSSSLFMSVFIIEWPLVTLDLMDKRFNVYTKYEDYNMYKFEISSVTINYPMT